MPKNPNLPHWIPGQRIMSDDLNRLAEAMRYLQEYFGDNFVESGLPRDKSIPGIPEWFVGITKTTPCPTTSTGGSNADYTDARYYVSRAIPALKLKSGDLFDAQTDDFVGGDPSCVTATNLAELPASALDPNNPIKGSTHNLPKNTIVRVWAIPTRANPMIKHYVFDGGALNVFSSANFTGSDATGIYSTSHIQTGSPTGMVPAGLTAGAACTVVNMAEQGPTSTLKSHWLGTGGIYAGFSAGTDANNNNQPFVFICAPNPQSIFPVTLASTSGATGTQTSASTWSYTATDLHSTQLGTGLSPTKPRPFGTSTAATVGIGYFNVSGVFVLLEAYEKEGSGHC